MGGREAFLSMSLARAEGAWASDVTSVSGHLKILLKGTLVLLVKRALAISGWGGEMGASLSDKRHEAT